MLFCILTSDNVDTSNLTGSARESVKTAQFYRWIQLKMTCCLNDFNRPDLCFVEDILDLKDSKDQIRIDCELER